ncbi:MAG: AAA family ATPase [Bacteroidota bacterium]
MIHRIVPLPETKSFFLFGARQTGKSTWVSHLCKGVNAWTINLLHTDQLLKYAKQPYMLRKEAEYKIINENLHTIFIDEIQKIPLLLNEVHALYDKYPDIRFILTGSSARKLRRGDVNLLAGRLLQYFLYPFVYSEIKESFDLERVLVFGSLPAAHRLSEPETIAFLNSYSQTYLKEEIQAESIVRNLGGFARFLDIAAAQSGELVNFSGIAREAALPQRTIQSYYQILEDTLIAFRLDAWRKSVRKRLTVHPKYFLFDNGIMNTLCKRLESKPNPLLRGRLFEHWLILETWRYINYFHPSVQMFYWRTHAGAEVDLLLVKSNTPIAACEIKASPTIESPHLRGLRSFREEHPEVPLYLICDAEHPYELQGVTILPWQNYLEKLESMDF